MLPRYADTEFDKKLSSLLYPTTLVTMSKSYIILTCKSSNHADGAVVERIDNGSLAYQERSLLPRYTLDSHWFSDSRAVLFGFEWFRLSASPLFYWKDV